MTKNERILGLLLIGTASLVAGHLLQNPGLLAVAGINVILAAVSMFIDE